MRSTNPYYIGMDSVVPPPNITEVIPKNGLFPSYVARAQRLTDAPSIYHVGALLACLSSVLAQKTKILFSGSSGSRLERIHLWVLMCGKSNNRKSHALDMCSGSNPDVVGALHPWFKDRLCPDSGTREGYEDFMIDHPDAFMAIREAPTWLADNRTVWMRNGAAWWCKIFDGQLEKKLRGKPDDETSVVSKRVQQVMIGICAAGETTAVLRQSRPTDWTGGMFSRMLILSAGRRKERHDFFDWRPSDLTDIRQRVSASIAVAKSARGVTITKEAWGVFDRWNDALQESADGLPLAQSTILGRLGRHVKVVSALYALSCGKTDVDAEIMRAAVNLGRYSHQKVLELPI